MAIANGTGQLQPREQLSVTSAAITLTAAEVDRLFERASATNPIEQRLKKVVSSASHSYCYEAKQPFDVILGWQDMAADAKEVACEATCPLELNLVKIPIKIELKGGIVQNGQLQSLKLERPVEVCYEITNLCEDHIFDCAAFLDV